MASPPGQTLPESRVAFLKSVLPASHQSIVDQLAKNSSSPPASTSSADVQKARLANDLARLSDDQPLIVKPLLSHVAVKNLRDVALNFNDDMLAALVVATARPRTPESTVASPGLVKETPAEAPAGETGKSSKPPALLSQPSSPGGEDVQKLVKDFQRRLFHEETSAVLSRMVREDDIPITAATASAHSGAKVVSASASSDNSHDNALKDGIVKFLQDNQPTFNIRQQSILVPLSDPKSFKGIDEAKRPAVTQALKKLQTTQALTHTPEAMPALFKANLHTAFQVSSMPQANFVARFADKLGGRDTALQIHTHATNARIRNDEALVHIHSTLRGSGLAVIDGKETRRQRLERVQASQALAPQANLEQLFGSMDYCACEDCTSITSPASYFVELLEFLRNNDLDPESAQLGNGWTNTPLEKLLRRRPDLANLELTCANTNTVLPYIDLANEVMESFVVHLDVYKTDPDVPKQSSIDAFNIDPSSAGEGGSSAELLAEPQNTNYNAYCILKSAVYPAVALPFNQPIEEVRLFLGFLKTSRAEIGEVFRESYTPPTTTISDTGSPASSASGDCSTPSSCSTSSSSSDSCSETESDNNTPAQDQPLTPELQAELVSIHDLVLQRADDAELLLITQEEYIIITKQAFWPKRYFDIRHGTTFTTSDYQTKIGVMPIYNYWGVDYTSVQDMLSTDEAAQIGLTFVKKQFLPRSGILYEDLANLLKTQFINPNLPTAKSLVTMESIKFSYMFLTSLIDLNAKTTKDRFKQMLAFLDSPTASPTVGDTLKQLLAADQERSESQKSCGHSSHPKNCDCKARSRLHHWIYKHFEKVGRTIVLESGEGPRMPWEADFIIQAKKVSVVVPSVPKLALIHPKAPSGPPDPSDLLPDGLPDPTDTDQVIAHLGLDGRIVAADGFVMARVSPSGEVLLPDWKPWAMKYGSETVYLRRTDQTRADGDYDASIYQGKSYIENYHEETAVTFMPVQDDCNLDNVRLRHLDGSCVTEKEYDRIHRFLRLWKKVGWSMQELDCALRGLGAINEDGSNPSSPASTPGQNTSGTGSSGSLDVDWTAFQDSCTSGNCGSKNCKHCCHTGGKRSGSSGPGGSDPSKDHPKPPKPRPIQDITPGFLHQVQAVNKLVALTGLSLLQILAFWTSIDTFGDSSLYAQLFLTHNIVGTDPIFKPDANGNYLTVSPTPKISDHTPVLLAAFLLKADGLNAILALGKIPDELSLENVSAIYRYSLLASILTIKPIDLPTVSSTFDSPWTSAQATLDLVNLWNRVSTAGFSLKQLAYVTENIDNPQSPVGPSQTTILKTTKTLYDGLNDIDIQNQDVTDIAAATADAVTSKAQLFFGTTVAAQIESFLDGNMVFSTNAPKGLTFKIPDDLKSRVKYADGDNSKLQISGQLTPDAAAKLRALTSNAKWAQSIGRLAKQALSFFNTTLIDVFTNVDEAKGALLVGDVIPDTTSSSSSDGSSGGSSDGPQPTAPSKRFYFLQNFMPFLRRKLAEQLINDTMSSVSSLPIDVTSVLLSSVLIVKDSSTNAQQSALAALGKIHQAPPEPLNAWTGYLVVSTTDTYTFSCLSVKDDDQPPDMILDNQRISFNTQQPDPTNVWFATPVSLLGGRTYSLQLLGQPTSSLQWMTARSVPAQIPPNALLPDYSIKGTSDIFAELTKAAIVINGFNLSAGEISYLQTNGPDFGPLDLNAVTLAAWKRLDAYTTLRKSIPTQTTTLIDFFKWAISSGAQASDLLSKINATTQWDASQLAKLCAPSHFNLSSPSQFKNEVNLVKLHWALRLADKIGIDIDKLFSWARPNIKFWSSRAIAQDMRNAVRATMRLTDWETAVTSLFGSLRKSQSAALSAYLTVQPELVEQGVIDSDSLFEFFLIDVNMGACLQTSRLKEATSSVQQFIQRCILGLEDRTDGNGVSLNELDRDRWTWMQKYRVWEAGRKVFLYPENWIVSSLRDDKSPIYEDLESALMQKDVTSQTITDSVQAFLFSLDEVANLEVIGAYLQDETITIDDGLGQTKKHLNFIHIFGRSRRSPFFFFYRYYDILAQNWAPWQPMQVDIPNYDTTDGSGLVTGNGAYLIPFTFNGRLLVGVPQLTKKTMPAAVDGSKDWNNFGSKPMAGAQPTDYWELKMGYSELRNGKWTQKVTTNQAFYENPLPTPLPGIDSFQFIPRSMPAANGLTTSVAIDCVRQGTHLVGRFAFDGALLAGFGAPKSAPLPDPGSESFQYANVATGPDPSHITVTRVISSLQAQGDSGSLTLYAKAPYISYGISTLSWPQITYSQSNLGSPVSQPFSHEFVHQLMGQVAATNSIDSIYAYFQTITNTDDKSNAFGQDDSAVYSELKRPYSLYNWELGFHAPMALADSYLKTQQFDLALKMMQYVFNPFSKGTDITRFWRWPPFREVNALNSMEKLFDSLQANTPDSDGGQINQWRDDPFSPHVIARLRPVAYMKWAAMKYIEILVAYGDYYFTQNTLEMIPMAIQCYVLASHVYGPRGQKIPQRGKKRAQTYKSLGDQWDPFGNAMVQLELMFPFSNQTDQPFGQSNGVVGLANIFGFATQRYFCIPDNPQLMALRDTIDDRLFKIRHCQDIFGNVQHLPLYEPPIDPGLLVAAAAQGLSIASVLNDLDTTMANFRFNYLLSKALDLCGELRSLGAQLLAAKERQDIEALALLRQTQEGMILSMGMDQKKMSLDEAQKTLDSLNQSRMLPAYKMQHNLQLLGLPITGVPAPEANVVEIAAPFPDMVEDSGLKLITSEKEEIDKANAAADWQEAIGILETVASVFHVLPTMNMHGQPLGIGMTACWGFANLANAVTAVARGLQVHAADLTYQSQSASKTTGFTRGTQDRVLNANSAAYEVKNIDKQILAQNIRIALADHEIAVQQQMMDNSAEVNDFLKNKYTNVQLYQWLQGGIQTLYYQLYTMAHDWAKKAELSFRVERGLDTTNFIQFGYWESAYSGMLSGDRLYLSLKQMEEAYNETRGYDFEVSKMVSLRQTSPLALLQLRDSGNCQFSIPEILYDMDFPGHYQRKIKSVAVTVPCVVGPYTGLNCTLRLLAHKYRAVGTASSGGDYAPKVDQDDDRFRTNNIPISAIAVSTAQSDAGVFELAFHDERLMPFEGAGAVSDWYLELPDGFRQFDYASITDVVLQVRYTANNGGAALAAAAAQYVATYIKTISDVSQTDGLFALFDVKNEFAGVWYQAMRTPPPAGSTGRVFTLADLNARLPVYTKGHLAKNILASDVMVVTDAALSPGSLALSQGGAVNTTGFGPGSAASFKTMSVFAAGGLAMPMDSWALTVNDTQTPIGALWILVRYSLR